MKHLNIQIQPERIDAAALARVRPAVESLAGERALVAGFQTKEGDDEGAYLNFTFLAKDLAALWQRIERDLLDAPEFGADLAAAAIVICEGEDGWNDYRLLHHFDPELPLDPAPA